MKLNGKDITANRTFCYAAKPFLSDKIKSRENTILVHNEKIVSDETEAENSLNDSVLNVIKNLCIPEYHAKDNLHDSLSRNPTLKAILKYRNHACVIVIDNFSLQFSSFHFLLVNDSTFLKEIRRLGSNKAVQDTGVTVRILQENAKFFA